MICGVRSKEVFREVKVEALRWREVEGACEVAKRDEVGCGCRWEVEASSGQVPREPRSTTCSTTLVNNEVVKIRLL